MAELVNLAGGLCGGKSRGKAIGRTLACLALISLLMVGGCKKRPEKVLSDSEMEDLLVDLILADAYEQSDASRKLPDSIRRSLGDAVLNSHGIDRETLDSTYSWYARNLDDYYRLYSKVDRRLNKKRSNVSDGRTELDNDVWNLPGHIEFSPLAHGDAFTFTLPAQSVSKGESLEWNLKLSSDAKTEVVLGIDYTNGATSLARRDISGDRNIRMTIIADTALTPRRVFGSMHVERGRMPLWVDSISLLRMPFDSMTYMNYRSQRYFTPPAKRRPADAGHDTPPQKINVDSVASSGIHSMKPNDMSHAERPRPANFVSTEELQPKAMKPGASILKGPTGSKNSHH